MHRVAYLPLREAVAVGGWRLIPAQRPATARPSSTRTSATRHRGSFGSTALAPARASLERQLRPPAGRIGDDIPVDQMTELRRAIVVGLLEGNPTPPALVEDQEAVDETAPGVRPLRQRSPLGHPTTAATPLWSTEHFSHEAVVPAEITELRAELPQLEGAAWGDCQRLEMVFATAVKRRLGAASAPAVGLEWLTRKDLDGVDWKAELRAAASDALAFSDLGHFGGVGGVLERACRSVWRAAARARSVAARRSSHDAQQPRPVRDEGVRRAAAGGGHRGRQVSVLLAGARRARRDQVSIVGRYRARPLRMERRTVRAVPRCRWPAKATVVRHAGATQGEDPTASAVGIGWRGMTVYLEREGKLIEMTKRRYDAEDVLQSLIATYPDLLAGENDPSERTRLVLIEREVSIADSPDAAGRWSLDHLFVDQDGVPTLVEVKRSSDTRIRREVVGQMLDYAANGPRYWPPGSVRAHFEARCSRGGDEPAEVLQRSFGGELAVEAWWTTVDTNLREGTLRLLFVADEISQELKAIIEFLNEQMVRTTVLGVELPQFADETGSQRMFVPGVIGLSERAESVKVRKSRRWTAKEWLERHAELAEPEDVAVTR